MTRGGRPSPLGAVARGVAAGLVGTAVMTGWQELSARIQGSGEQGGGQEQQQQPSDPWEQASAPAQVARKVARGVFDHDLPPSAIPYATHGMHWAYGTGWGVVYGLVQGTRAYPPVRHGLLFGTAVWVASYLQLVPMGLYAPPWTYGPKGVAMDLSYHWAYGAGVAAGHRVIAGR